MGRKALVDDNNEIDILARTIWGEARGEGSQGMQAVANVIQNRVKQGGWWGATFAEVCKKKSQFSCWNEGDPNHAKLLAVTMTDRDFVTARAIATAPSTAPMPFAVDANAPARMKIRHMIMMFGSPMPRA